MPPLYVSEQGCVIKMSGKRLIIAKLKEILLDIPIINLDRVIIVGNVQITSQAIALLLDNGIEVAFLSSRGKLRGILKTPQAKNIFLRIAQYDRWRDEEFKLKFAKCIIRAKLKNQIMVLSKYSYNHPELSTAKYLKTITDAINNLPPQNTMNQLMGLEGAASGAYFSCFAKMLRSELEFKTRLHHPSPDPVNALLSLGYTLVTNEIASLLESASFDPLLGFVHGIRYGRKSLALDIIEEFRHPLIDRFTIMLINNKVFADKDFEKMPDGSVYLIEEGRRKYFALYETRMREKVFSLELNWRGVLRRQISGLEYCIMKNGEYEPFLSKI